MRPGNIRELQNIIERAVILTKFACLITLLKHPNQCHLPGNLRGNGQSVFRPELLSAFDRVM